MSRSLSNRSMGKGAHLKAQLKAWRRSQACTLQDANHSLI
jgi:hypothetical protein